ncbi:hypothetical protein [Geothermobacter hydrogeniphilus]|uniref:ACT domain-containing protein n=1 Tax=Geothermobacter hydrogeniphilus TaxID=1969733 RepID=A0A1X0XX31_9BACT|nr:hypothetical protein [Geothermobacter hydrogeniphilus]ORJ57429.1 hypothetical protein B5V00_13940 [Geothermobacter hydrogeniphilus]
MKRITVIAGDRKGLIADLTELLAAGGVNILTINAQCAAGSAYLRLRAEPYDRALALLRDAGYQAVSDQVLVLRIPDRPGNLARVARRLAEQGVDIRGLTMVQRDAGFCVVAVATDDRDTARQVLREDVLDIP